MSEESTADDDRGERYITVELDDLIALFRGDVTIADGLPDDATASYVDANADEITFVVRSAEYGPDGDSHVHSEEIEFDE